jgi:F-type H+-transporting ATPase subunit delta
MSNIRVIKRYAYVLLDNADAAGLAKSINSDAIIFVGVCKSNRELTTILKNPVIKGDKKLGIIYALFKDKFNKVTLEFIDLIISNHREIFLKEIFENYISFYKIKQGILEAELITAIPVEASTLISVSEYLKKKTGVKEVELNNSINKDIIGGFTLKYRDKLIDASIARRIEELKKHLLN